MKKKLNLSRFKGREQLFKHAAALLAALTMLFAASAQADDSPLIMALGDSLTAGYGLGPGEAFPKQLQNALRENGLGGATVKNAGVSGDTTAGGRSRLAWNISALPETPDLVIVELGANDALRGIQPETTRRNLDAILAYLTERGIPVLLAGMLAPPNLGDDYGQEFNAIYPELAKRYNVPLYPFFLDGVAADASLNQADGIHPTKDGIAIITTKIMPAVLKALASAQTAAPPLQDMADQDG